jgi:hypothetical protein
MNNNVVVILSHADSELKINELKRCINAIKLIGYKIIISSHIELPIDIVNTVDYISYSDENRLIWHWEFDEYPAGYYRSINFNTYRHSMRVDYDHGYSALTLIKNGVSLAINKGYDISHIVNYDYIINQQDFFDVHSKGIGEDYSVISYGIWSGCFLNSGFLSVVNKDVHPLLNNISSLRDYSDYHLKTLNKLGVGVLESMLYYLFSDLKVNNIDNSKIDLTLNEFDTIKVTFSKNTIDNNIELYKSKYIGQDYIVILNYGSDMEYFDLTYNDYSKLRVDYKSLYDKVKSYSHVIAFKIPDWIKNKKIDFITSNSGIKTIDVNENTANCHHMDSNIIFDI